MLTLLSLTDYKVGFDIVCDSPRAYIAGYTHWLSPVLDVPIGEAMGRLFALQFVRRRLLRCNF